MDPETKQLYEQTNIYDAILLNLQHICFHIEFNEKNPGNNLDTLIIIFIEKLLYVCDPKITDMLFEQTGSLFSSYLDRLPIREKQLTGGSSFNLKTIAYLIALLACISTVTNAILLISKDAVTSQLQLYLKGTISMYPNYKGICVANSLVFLGDKISIEGRLKLLNYYYYKNEISRLIEKTHFAKYHRLPLPSIEFGVIPDPFPYTRNNKVSYFSLSSITRKIEDTVYYVQNEIGRKLYQDECVVVQGFWMKPTGKGHAFNIIINGPNVMFVDPNNLNTNLVTKIERYNKEFGIVDVGFNLIESKTTDIVKAFKLFLSETGASSPYTESTIPDNYLKLSLTEPRSVPIYIVNSTDIKENAELSYKAVEDIVKNMTLEFSKIQGMTITELFNQSDLKLLTPKRYQEESDKFVDYHKKNITVDDHFILSFIALTSFIGVVVACFTNKENEHKLDSMLKNMQENLAQITKYENVTKKSYLQLTRGGKKRKLNRTRRKPRF